ncbi:protein arginine kinase activator [Seinonella peptonophila]|uniref:Protein arginine kinase activator n=1 Tax=Seinonella peptonophila TaxID=112248 RepID=A0A1M4YUA9_9BACL|nr:UvrB/UvrC motif-containing protein [Seinonella peptonophila]SHF09062.1 protein arginine kinase activator [Seinonella peptonophila]
MLCPECGKRPATLHYTKIVNGKKSEFHICEVCAKAKEEQLPDMDSSFSFHQLLSGLLNFDIGSGTGESNTTVQPQTIRCSTCGLTYQQFSKVGRFGCSDCYDTFKEYLDPMFRRMHGHTIHRGKVPVRTEGKLKMRRELDELKQEMVRLVQNEEFERAAQVRDQIRQIEERLQS